MDRERARDSSRERIEVRDRPRERLDAQDIRIRDIDLERERLLLEQRLQQELEERPARRRLRETEGEGDLDRIRRRLVVSEEGPNGWLRRSDGNVIIERGPRVDDRTETEEFRRRERPRTWSTEHLHSHSPSLPHPPPPPPPPAAAAIYPDMPRPSDTRTTALPYKPTSPLSSGSGLVVHSDRRRGDSRTSQTAPRERPSSDSSLRPIHVHNRPRSAFAAPYPIDEPYYGRTSRIERDTQSGRRPDGYHRSPASVIVLGNDGTIYHDGAGYPDPKIEIRYRGSPPSSPRRDYGLPMVPPPVPPYISTPRASSPAKPASTPAPAAAKPTAADKPTEDTKMREKLLNFLCSYSPGLVYQNLVKTRVKDSGKWLFALPMFKKWREMKTSDDADTTDGGRSNCIWLSGNLGTGKTLLMSAVIDHLLTRIKGLPENKRTKTAIVYFYFDHTHPSRPRDAIASLLRQLCSQKDVGPLPRFLADNLAAMKKGPDSKGDATDTAITGADEEFLAPIPVGDMIADFLSLQLRFDSVYICLDGLEECDDLVALFEFLVRLVGPSSPSRLIISARPQIIQPGIVTGIGSKDMVVVLEQHNAPDIRRYLETYTKKHDCLADIIGQEELPEHVKMIAERSGGNFLAATVETAELNRLTTKFDVKQYMNRPSIGFSELFSQIWSRLDDQPPLRAILAKRIFYWLSVSRRPLALKELQQAIAIEPEKYHTAQVLEGERLPPPSVIEEACMGFIRVDETNNSVFSSPSALPFYFYLFNPSFAKEASRYAAKCCLAFLNSEILSNGPFKSQKEYDEMDQKLPFSRYVSQYWGTHLNDSRGSVVQETVEGLLGNVPLMDTMNQLLHFNRSTVGKRRRYDDYPSGFGGQHFGAYFHLRAALKKWASPQDWEVPADSWGRKPLHVASTSPSLYSKHVMFDACRNDAFGLVISATPLPQHERSPSPHISVGTPIIDKGGTKTEEGSKGFRCEPVSALSWSWSPGGDVIERLKMQIPFTREEIATPDNQGKTPLHHFINEWSEDRFGYILNTLYEQQHPSDDGNDVGSDSNTDEVDLLPTLADHDGHTILDYACMRNAIYVHLVFTASTWSPENISSAIVAAATGGHLWPLKQLLELVVSKFGTEPLKLDLKAAVIEASKRGFTDIVRLLRRQGADLSKPEQDKQGMTALHYAAYGSHLETVRYLLLEGADPNYLDELGKSPLFCASESGNKGIVSLLIEKGASPNAVNSEGFSSLQLAARNGNLDVVKKLLRFLEGGDRTARASSRLSGVESKSPLHFAAENGHNDVVQLLLDEGLPCDGKDSDGRTPLSYACQTGFTPTVKLLLAQKVDVNTQDSTGRTPLSYAAAGGHVDAIVLLMGRSEFDPNVPDNEAKSPLIHAAQNGHGDIVILLAVLSAEAEERSAIIRAYGGVLSKLVEPPTCHKLTDIDHPDKEGRTVRDYLRQTKNDKVIEFLDTMGDYKAREGLQEPGVDQGPDVVMTDVGSDVVTMGRDAQAGKAPPAVKASAQEPGPSSLETVVVVDKRELTPVAEESEDTMGENSMGVAGSEDKGDVPMKGNQAT